MPLASLDAELIRIPRFSSRAYFGDALKCYRVGAFRAANSSTWVAAAYDLIRKYRELDGLGDAEAQVFLQNWDVSVPANNIAKLLELERSLIDHAHKKMAVIDAMGLRALKRLPHRSEVGPLGQEALEHAPRDPNHAAVLTKLDPKLHGLPMRAPAGISPPSWRPVQRPPTRGSGSSSHTGNMPPAVSTLALTHQRAINDCA